MVYLLEDTEGLNTDFLTWGMPYLSRQRSEKLAGYGTVRDKTDGCAAYILLRIALLKEYGITQAPVFVFGEHDKPYLRDYPAIHFNISHCKTAVGCILSDKATAIDVTDLRQLRNDISKRVCSISEQQRIEKSADPTLCFLEYWTRKECYAKLTGEGMSRAFSGITDELPEMKDVHTMRMKNYIVSYYAADAVQRIIMKPEELKQEAEKLFSGI